MCQVKQWEIYTLLTGFVLILSERRKSTHAVVLLLEVCVWVRVCVYVCVRVCVLLLKCSYSIASTQRDKSWQTKGIVGFRDYFQLSYSGWRGATPQKHFN